MKGSFNHGPARGPHPAGPRHRAHGGRPQILPGITTPVLEAITNTVDNIPDMDDLGALLADHGKLSHLKLLEAIKAEGVRDVRGAIELLVNDEACETLQIRRKLMILLLNGKAIGLLNLPPHICNTILPLCEYDQVFRTDDHLPPHLRHTNYKHLSQVSAPVQLELASKMAAVVLEGYFNQDRLYISSLAADFIFVLSTGVLKELYVHSIDRIPPHASFVPVQLSRSDVQIMEV